MALAALAVADLVAPGSPRALLSLDELDGAPQQVMSCGDADAFAGNEPMWCSDPSSPQCIPAVPQGQAPDLSDHSAPAALLGSAAGRLAYVWLAWPEPAEQHTTARSHGARLERPPRT